MNTATESQESQGALVGVIVLTSLLGFQLVRGLLPYFRPLLSERLGWSTISTGLFALLIFLCAFLAAPLNRFLGSGLVFLTACFVTGVSRLASQLWAGDPIVGMIYVAAGVVAFIIFLPTATGLAMHEGRETCAAFALSVLGGLALDLALNGAFFTYDLIWQKNLVPAVIVVALILAQWLLLYLLMRRAAFTETMDARLVTALSWTAVGPLLFLEYLIFANIAWAITRTGWSFASAFFWLLLAHACGLVVWIMPVAAARWILATAWAMTLITQIVLTIGQANSWVVALYLTAGQVVVAGTLVTVSLYLGANASLDNLRNISLAGGIGMIIFVVLMFAYYAVYDIALPFSNQILPVIAFILVALFSMAALRYWWRSDSDSDTAAARTVLVLVLILLLVPIGMLIIRKSAPSTYPDDGSLRVMTYNLHYGANIQGQLDLETLAQVIEAQNPDVVALQEVSRGWIINGSVDMLAWLANRLQMQPVFGPAADAQWGNAILSRIPVLEVSSHELPTDDLLLKRSFMHARLQSPDSSVFELINTHYHNPEDGGAVRILQSQRILDYTQNLQMTILTGDLNAEHGMPEIDMLAEGGFTDVLDLAGVEPGHTNPVPDPFRQIDYIWTTPDWSIDSALIPYSEASDHLPIAVTLRAN